MPRLFTLEQTWVYDVEFAEEFKEYDLKDTEKCTENGTLVCVVKNKLTVKKAAAVQVMCSWKGDPLGCGNDIELDTFSGVYIGNSKGVWSTALEWPVSSAQVRKVVRHTKPTYRAKQRVGIVKSKKDPNDPYAGKEVVQFDGNSWCREKSIPAGEGDSVSTRLCFGMSEGFFVSKRHNWRGAGHGMEWHTRSYSFELTTANYGDGDDNGPATAACEKGFANLLKQLNAEKKVVAGTKEAASLERMITGLSSNKGRWLEQCAHQTPETIDCFVKGTSFTNIMECTRSLQKAAQQKTKTPAPLDVAAVPKDATKTASGLASKILKAGTGKAHPTANSTVTVHYTGWTTDGKMFDSSVSRGQPISFGLNQVIPGWTEGLQLMVVGEKRRLWIPEGLAYKGRPGAPAGTLVFDVELLRFE